MIVDTGQRVGKTKSVKIYRLTWAVEAVPISEPVPKKFASCPVFSRSCPGFTEQNRQINCKNNHKGSLLFPIWQKRLAAIFNRRPTRNWDPDELKAFDALVPIDDTELATVERYYAANRKREGSICRTTLLRLLRHWSGEVDRAEKSERDRAAKSRRFEQRKPTAAAPAGGPATDADFKRRAGDIARRELERLWASQKPGGNERKTRTKHDTRHGSRKAS